MYKATFKYNGKSAVVFQEEESYESFKRMMEKLAADLNITVDISLIPCL